MALVIFAVLSAAAFCFVEIYARRIFPQSPFGAAASLTGANNPRAPKSDWDSSLKLHPLFGYTFNPVDKNVNNYGFRCPYDFVLNDGMLVVDQVGDEALIIGIFGGSFADEGCRLEGP